MLGKKEIANALGLSCVENYFLPWLEKSYDVTLLYGASFVSLGQVIKDFAHGAIYENYNSLPRLQDVAEDNGITRHKYFVCGAEEATERIRNSKADELCLIRVDPKFFANFKRAAWREDHYVCVDGSMNWINEYPLSSGAFSNKTFACVYGGVLCVYKTKDLSAVPPVAATDGFVFQNFELPELPESVLKLESAVAVLRVTRKRLEKFYAATVGAAQLLHEENLILDKLYFDLHICSLRNGLCENARSEYARKLFGECLGKICEIEKKTAEILKK